MKSRIAGSLVQALCKAARTNSAGTPARKNATMSVSATISSMEGRLARSNGASGAFAGLELSISLASFAACFKRAQRSKGFSRSLIASFLYPLLIALPFDEGTLHMMRGDEPVDDDSNFCGHRHRFDQIVAGI